MSKNTFGRKTSLLIGLVAFLGLGARAATWTGAGEDNLWSNPENWDGDMPSGASAAANFDSATKDVTVDVAQVKTLTISENYTGTLTLANDFIVADTYSQANGTFTCGDKNFTIGKGTDDGASGPNVRGFFTLSGGTFNCSSGITHWRPTNNSPVFQIAETAIWNHNNGEFVLGGPNNNSANFKANVTFYNLRFWGKRRPVFAGGTTNRVLGTLTSHGVGFNSNGGQGSQIASPDSWFSTGAGKNATLAVEGDLYFDNAADSSYAWGGTGVILLCNTEKDQVIHFDNGHLPTLVINKPAGKKVMCDIPDGQKLVFYGIGSGMNPHLFVQSGTFVMPDAGISFPNARYTDIFQTDGVIENTKGGFDLKITNQAFVYMNEKIGNLTIAGAPLQTIRDLMVTGDVSLASGGKFTVYVQGENEWAPVFCGEGDQHYLCAHQSSIVTSGSSWYGRIKIDKPSGKLYLDSPLYAKFVTFVQGAHVVFPITNATSEVTAIGEGGWNSPAVIQAERDISLPKDERMCLEVTGKLNAESPMKWNIFKWGVTLSANYAPENLDIILPPNLTHPRMTQDVTQKLVYLSYRLKRGLALFVR